MERKGVSGATHNQRIEFIMSICNPRCRSNHVAARQASDKSQDAILCLKFL